jgi:hypothetical protein
MAYGQTDICNLALLKLGASSISSIDDGSTNADALALVYDMIRDRLVRDEDWDFAIQRANLTMLAAAPNSDHFTYQYTLPTEPPMLRFLDIPDFPDDDWAIEGGVLLTNLQEVVCRYVAQVTDEVSFPEDFIEYFAAELAAAVAVKLTDSLQMRALMQQEATSAYTIALANNKASSQSESMARREQAATTTWADR